MRLNTEQQVVVNRQPRLDRRVSMPGSSGAKFAQLKSQITEGASPSGQRELREALQAVGAEPSSTSNKQRLSEQQFYAAHIYQQLKEKDPELAKQFSNKFKDAFEDLRADGRGNKWFFAADAAMRDLVKSDLLSRKEQSKISQIAFGKAQCNGDNSELSGSRTLTIDKGVHAEKFNQIASGESLQRWKSSAINSIKSKPMQSDPIKSPPVGSQPSAEISPPNQVNPTNQTAGTLAPDAPRNAPEGFLWKPRSDSDGRLVVLLPSQFLGRVAKVEVVSADGSKVLATGRYAGIGNGVRLHFRFDRSGSNFPNNVILQVTLTDGQIGGVRIPNPSSRIG